LLDRTPRFPVACTRHRKNQARHLRRLIHLDTVSSTSNKKQLGCREQLMEALGDTLFK
jgi:hypothetical protein